MTFLNRRLFLAAGLAFGTALGGVAHAADNKVTIGFQTGVDPAKAAQAAGAYEKATGWQIAWRKFDSGADVIAAIASGDVQIGYVGSSPLAAAASRKLPIETIFVAALLGDSEELVVRDTIKDPKDLAGKKIGVPFVSTSHYSLLAALKHWNIEPKSVQILNLRPPELAAAFERGDIDGGMSGIRPSASSRKRARCWYPRPTSPNGARRPSMPGSLRRISPRLIPTW